MELEGKIALVTGAGRRVGKAIAGALASAGADIALHYHLSADRAHETAEQIASLGRRVELYRADLADPRQIEAMFASISADFSRLDVLVNSASVYKATPIDSLTPPPAGQVPSAQVPSAQADQWDRQFAVNARAPALCISQSIPLMSAGGAIVNIADTSATAPRRCYAAYCASKAALLSLTRSAAVELAPKIRVNAVSPGTVLWHAGEDDRQRQAALALVPLGRVGRPEDVVAAVLLLLRNDYMTGQEVRVDGGRNMT